MKELDRNVVEPQVETLAGSIRGATERGLPR